MRTRWFAVGAVLVAAALLVAGSVGAADYPERSIKLIVPWAAGGDTDAILRVFASLAEKHFGQVVVVANIGGASGTVGAREAKKSPADGYTIYSGHDSLHTTYWTGVSEISYKDFEPICLISATPSIVATHPKTKWSTMKELLEDAKNRPGQITFGATLGSTSHFFPAMIEKETGVRWKYVSYEGTAPRMTALLGGHIELGETNLTQSDKVKAGQLRMLAIATEKRSPEVPFVPTLKELGINVTYAVNRGLFAPKGTPEPILQKWEEVCRKATEEKAFHEAMKTQGTLVNFLGRKAYADFLAREDAANAAVAQALGFKRKG
ncbi:MAG: tripartite tricarboxylate transporter substrate binding protein [Candidatus Methylomirabilales bacterium]